MNEDEALVHLQTTNDADYFLIAASIDEETIDEFVHVLRGMEERRKNCCLVLTTNGGDPDAGYRAVRAIKRFYTKFTLYVFGACKSTGTLMALGADEIVMSDFGEFGPLDIQLAKDDEMWSNVSGLNFIQSFASLNEQLFSAFEDNFLAFKRKSRNAITTKTAADIATKLATGIISPISAQIDPVKFGEVQRSINIAREYGKRLCKNPRLVNTLIGSYPSHSFVIDYEEAKKLFENLRWVNEEEKILEGYLIDVGFRNETGLPTIMLLEPDEAEEPTVSEKETEPTQEPLLNNITGSESTIADIATTTTNRNGNGNGKAKSKKQNEPTVEK